MTLALSADDGLTWPWQRNLEVGDGWCMSNDSARGLNREYSYPSMRQSADGALHLAYTVFRKHIRHVRVMPEWITKSSNGIAPVEQFTRRQHESSDFPSHRRGRLHSPLAFRARGRRLTHPSR